MLKADNLNYTTSKFLLLIQAINDPVHGKNGKEIGCFQIFDESVMDGPTDQRANRWMDAPAYRDARIHLKIIFPFWAVAP